MSLRVGLGRSQPGYGEAEPPFHPGVAWPELAALFGEALETGPSNPAYAAVRAALFGLGLDAARFGEAGWNPLGELVPRGGCVVLKPNWIRHFNPLPEGSLLSVVTHGAILRAVADYAWLAVGREGRVVVAEAPQQDCDFEQVRSACGVPELVAFYKRSLGCELPVVDLRREQVHFEDGVIVKRTPLPGDPRGYRAVDIGHHSFFEGAGLDPRRFRGADYDPVATSWHHSGGRHQYLLSETVLQADLVVNLPKLKTHKKTGVTLALKNLVGINGDKNWLPHHTQGPPSRGGDEFPDGSRLARLRGLAVERARPWLARGRLLGLSRAVRRLERRVAGEDFVRAGNWHGNQTTWRMAADLNRAVYYSDREGLRLEAEGPVRRVLTVLDGGVAGEGAGPLAPRDVPLGVVVAGLDPVAVDLVAVRLMGFDARRIPKLARLMDDEGPRITAVREPTDVRVHCVEAPGFAVQAGSLEMLKAERPFEPHPGWAGHIEAEAP